MTVQGWGLILLFTLILIALIKPMGMWLFAVYEGRRTPFHVVLGSVERGFYRLAGIDPNAEQNWRRYAAYSVATGEELGTGMVVHQKLAARRFACPACGLLHAVDVCRAAEPDPHDIRLNLP